MSEATDKYAPLQEEEKYYNTERTIVATVLGSVLIICVTILTNIVLRHASEGREIDLKRDCIKVNSQLPACYGNR